MSVATLRRRLRAFTLVELIVFIVIMGIAAYALLSMFRQTLPRSPSPSQLTQAAHCAQERMELILGRRVALGTLGLVRVWITDAGGTQLAELHSLLANY